MLQKDLGKKCQDMLKSLKKTQQENQSIQPGGEWAVV
jgi:hypothetical protein